jgi:hypothetical protein
MNVINLALRIWIGGLGNVVLVVGLALSAYVCAIAIIDQPPRPRGRHQRHRFVRRAGR